MNTHAGSDGARNLGVSMSTQWPRGAEWGKWDLHVHTPASLVQNYGGDKEEVWDRFFADIEALPSEFRVLGINDYMFVDGYEKVVSARQRGRLANIETVMCVVELRVPTFGGTDGELSRVNLHVIFSERIPPKAIRSQFVNALHAKFQLSPESDGVKWAGVPTRESLGELGKAIRETSPDRVHAQLPSDVQLGFNNLAFQFADVQEILSRPTFDGNTLTAIGKAEWSTIRWQGQATAEKKHLINSSALVFTAVDSEDAWLRGRDRLRAESVNDKLLDCSDAHAFSTSSQKDRIGNCLTWIHADPTFEGLRHALHEFDGRVFVGNRPPQLERVSKHATRYVRSVAVRPTSSTQVVPSLDFELPLNPGFVAVIGGRGSGKSALADTIGLLGNSHTSEYFSFLQRQRFRSPPENKARRFVGTLTWESGDPYEASLDSDPAPHSVQRLRYVPQHYLERICNELASGTAPLLERELAEVLFGHVPEPDRLGERTLEGVISARTRALAPRLAQLRTELSAINGEIVSLEEQTSIDHKARLLEQLRQRQADLDALVAAKPLEVASPRQGASEAHQSTLTALREQRQQVAHSLIQASRDDNAAALTLAAARRVVAELVTVTQAYTGFVERTQSDLSLLGISVADVAQLSVRRESVDARVAAATIARAKAAEARDSNRSGSLAYRHTDLETQIAAIEREMDAPVRAFQDYERLMTDWYSSVDAIVGPPEAPGTISYIEQQVDAADRAPARLAEAEDKRRRKAEAIYEELTQLADIHRSLYAPAESYIGTVGTQAHRDLLNFDVSLTADGFAERFFGFISRGVAGTFVGADQGSSVLERRMSACDFDEQNSILEFLDWIVTATHFDLRTQARNPVAPEQQLKKDVTLRELYDYVFGLEYIQPRFVLKSHGQPLSQLSPGQKGTLLLVFYLLVDSSDQPLIIDQPEENLDNRSVYDLLVPAIRAARERRQVIVITHNPNLAVVADADQVIQATLDSNAFRYTSGSIEDPTINGFVIDVLEGTLPAFVNRERKYAASRPAGN